MLNIMLHAKNYKLNISILTLTVYMLVLVAANRPEN